MIVSENEMYSATTDSKGYLPHFADSPRKLSISYLKAGLPPIEQAITLTEGTTAKGDFTIKKQMQLVA